MILGKYNPALKNNKWIFFIIIFIGLLTGCTQTKHLLKKKGEQGRRPISIIPEPVSVKPQKGFFRLTRKATIQIPDYSKKSRYAGEYLRKKLHDATGFNIAIDSSAFPSSTGQIVLTLTTDTTGFGNKEGYKLTVTPQKVNITAPTPHGLFNGVQSLLQLFSPRIFQTDYTLVPRSTKWTIPAVEIRDYPRFAYRGMHLDVSRHYMPVWFIKEYIDLLAIYKMNRFHWHLTGDQGWRIQIKKYPKLTSIGAWRDSTVIGLYNSGYYDPERTGGFYTPEEIKDVVEYAKKHFIIVIPEIEMPGHSAAAIAAYPKLGCEEIKDKYVWSRWGSGDNSVYCPSDYTFNFLENVLKEVMKLFPSKYIHIGGDEVPKDPWKNSPLAQKVMKREGLANEDQLQSYFIKRIEKFLNVHGRQIIGWDEILEGGLAPNAMVESWRGVRGGISAAQQRHKVIMAPSGYYYFNIAQANPHTEPISQSKNSDRMISLKKVYTFNPIPDTLTAAQKKYIYGVEGALWTEYIASPRKAEYMLLPRLLALSETAWTPLSRRSWDSFWKRLQPQFKRFDVLDVDYGKQYDGKKPHLKKPKK